MPKLQCLLCPNGSLFVFLVKGGAKIRKDGCVLRLIALQFRGKRSWERPGRENVNLSRGLNKYNLDTITADKGQLVR